MGKYLNIINNEKLRELINEMDILAKRPKLMLFGKICSPKRRILPIGSYYYEQNNPGLSQKMDKWEKKIKQVFKFKIKHGYPNQCLVNFYDSECDNIGWHCDKITTLKYGVVFSVSFAQNKEDEEKVLSVMEFNNGKKIDLMHNTVVIFNAFKHKKDNIKHRIPKTLCPRVNFTFRYLK